MRKVTKVGMYQDKQERKGRKAYGEEEAREETQYERRVRRGREGRRTEARTWRM